MSDNITSRMRNKNYKKVAQLCFLYLNDSNKETFRKQLDDNFDINYKLPNANIYHDLETESRSPYANIYDYSIAGRTLFQLIDNTEMSKLLIDHGADYTVTNEDHSTILHKAVKPKYSKYVNILESGSTEAGELVDVVLSAHIKSGNTKNPRDQDGLTYFHIACICNHKEGVEFFLKNRVSVNETFKNVSTFCPGYSALHLAVKMSAVETTELLLKSGADMFVEDVKERNPLHVLIVERIKMFIALKKFSRMSSIVEDNWYYSNLQKNYHNNQRLITLFLDRIDKYRSDLLSLISLICTLEKLKVKQFIENNEEYFAQLVDTSSQALSGYTPVHFAALFSVEILELLVQNGATLDTKDANGVTPFDMCLKGFSVVDIHRIILHHPDYSSIVFSDDEKTKLSDFIYAMRETETFEVFLEEHLTHANMFIPFDSPVCAGYTPLHLTVICTEQPLNWSWKNHEDKSDIFDYFKSEQSQKYLSRIDACLRYNPDVTSRDARGSTPLHLAFRFQETLAVRRLLQRHETSSDYVDEYGLSHLHIACAARDVALVEKLLLCGANINQVATLAYMCLRVDENLAGYGIGAVDKYFIKKGSTPLHFAVAVGCPKIVKILINREADVLAKDAGGLNPLERMVGVSIFDDKKFLGKERIINMYREKEDIAQLLIRKITSILVNTKPDQMMYCYGLLDRDLLRRICQNNDQSLIKLFKIWDITALHLACFNRDLSQVQSLMVNNIDVNARVNLKSPLWPGCTPLHLISESFSYCDEGSMEHNDIPMAKILLEFGADVVAENAVGETALHQVFRLKLRGSESIYTRYLTLLLNYLKDFSVDPVSQDGFTHLHIASVMGEVSIVEKLLEQGAEVNRSVDYFIEKYGGFAAIHFAAAFQQKEVVDVLLTHGACVDRKSTYDENVLHAVNNKIRQPHLELLQKLFNAGADIHARNTFGETPFENVIQLADITSSDIDFFLENGCGVNTVNPISGHGFLAKALKADLSVFEYVVETPDVKEISDNGRNAIHNVVSFKRSSWWVDDDEPIEVHYPSAVDYFLAIDSLIQLGLNIDHQDYKGMTPLHVAAQMQNVTGIIGLLENGADVNITDANGKPAFAYSLEIAKDSEKKAELNILIVKVILLHLYKLNLARIGISEANRKIEKEMYEMYSFQILIEEEFKNEFDRMMREQINEQSVTFYELLSDTGAVSNFPYMLQCNREAIDYFFKNEVENLRENFPIMASALVLQYRKALARCRIVEAAFTSLDFLLGWPMPAVCSRIIFGFLSNDELNNLNTSMTILDE